MVSKVVTPLTGRITPVKTPLTKSPENFGGCGLFRMIPRLLLMLFRGARAATHGTGAPVQDLGALPKPCSGFRVKFRVQAVGFKV